jgi:hypothetical protein
MPRSLPHSSLEPLVHHRLILDEDPGTASLMKRLQVARRRGYLTKSEMEAVCRWKSSRALPLVRSNTPYRIRRATAAALSTRSERRRIEALLTLRGVSFPMASAALTLIDPKRYGVIDIRVWQLLHQVGAVEGNRAGFQFTFAQWSQFLAVIRALASQLGVSARVIERTLFFVHERYQVGTLYRVASSKGASQS